MAKIIALSGPCGSGKTTFIESVKDEIGVIDESIRKYITIPIDELRKDQNKYFWVQVKTICGRIAREWWIRFFKSGVYVADRSLFDSYYYFTRHVKFQKLNLFNRFIAIFYHFFLYVMLKVHDRVIYERMILLKPIERAKLDEFYRPKWQNSKIEYTEMHRLMMKLGLKMWGYSSSLVNVNHSTSLKRYLRELK